MPQSHKLDRMIFVISGLFKACIGLIIGVAVLVVLLMVWSRRLKKQSILIERRFFQNLRSRDVRAEYLGEKKPEYAGRLLSHDLHLADMEIPGESSWAGKTLLELNLGKKFGVHVASILRGKRRINIPGGSVRLFPMDKIQVIGTDEQLSVFNEAMQNGAKIDWDVYEKSEMALRQFIIDADSVFLTYHPHYIPFYKRHIYIRYHQRTVLIFNARYHTVILVTNTRFTNCLT